MASAQQRIKQERAERARQKCMSGSLPQVGEYPVSFNGSYRSVLPPAFFTNVSVSEGDTGTMYMDVESECLIICYGDGDE